MISRFASIKIISLLMLLMTFSFCRKEYSCENNFKSNASILGFDYTKCACCGGIMIRIDNVTSPGRNYFLAQNLPAGFDINSNSQFPIPVKLDWRLITSACGNFIEVTRIAKR